MTPNQHSVPQSDVLAEEYRGTYLWAALDKARSRIADLEEQLEVARDQLDVAQQIEELHDRSLENWQAAEVARSQIEELEREVAEWKADGSGWCNRYVEQHRAVAERDKQIEGLRGALNEIVITGGRGSIAHRAIARAALTDPTSERVPGDDRLRYACVCDETSTRNCPVHGNAHERVPGWDDGTWEQDPCG